MDTQPLVDNCEPLSPTRLTSVAATPCQTAPPELPILTESVAVQSRSRPYYRSAGKNNETNPSQFKFNRTRRRPVGLTAFFGGWGVTT